MSDSETQNRLMAALDFDEPDLDANAYGRLSKRQREKLKQTHRKFISCLTLLAIPLIAVPSLGFDFLFHVNWIMSSVCGGILVAWLIQIVAKVFENSRATANVEAVEGLVYPIVYQQKLQLREHFVQVGDMRFLVDTTIFEAFEYGDPYRIYYAPGSNTILSAEWLRNE